MHLARTVVHFLRRAYHAREAYSGYSLIFHVLAIALFAHASLVVAADGMLVNIGIAIAAIFVSQGIFFVTAALLSLIEGSFPHDT